MAHKIEEIDLGFLSGNYTWHGLKQYHLVGDRPVTIDEAAKTVDFDVRKVPSFIETPDGYKLSGAHTIIRTDTHGVLAPAVGDRYIAEPHKNLLNTMTEFLLAEYKDLKVCGCGTLSGGATWWIQMVAAQYYVRGDESPTELRLTFNHTYGVTAYKTLVTNVRIVCDNTRRMAEADAITKGIMKKHKHTASATTKINQEMSLMAELHLGLKREVEVMEHLAGQEVNGELVKGFLDAFVPAPGEDASTKAKNQFYHARQRIGEIFASGQSMTGNVKTSKYALFNAFTDYVDHDSYTRDAADRWMDSLDGSRADKKDAALAHLIAA